AAQAVVMAHATTQPGGPTGTEKSTERAPTLPGAPGEPPEPEPEWLRTAVDSLHDALFKKQFDVVFAILGGIPLDPPPPALPPAAAAAARRGEGGPERGMTRCGGGKAGPGSAGGHPALVEDRHDPHEESGESGEHHARARTAANWPRAPLRRGVALLCQAG